MKFVFLNFFKMITLIFQIKKILHELLTFNRNPHRRTLRQKNKHEMLFVS